LVQGRERETIKWPRLGLSKGWESSLHIRIVGWLFLAIPETVQGLRGILLEWHDCLAREIRHAGELTFTGDAFTANYEFNGPCGDAVMALFMLLTITRNLTSLQAVGFFQLDDFTTPFFDIRGENREEMPQTGWPAETA
jgi:hypothetical protein